MTKRRARIAAVLVSALIVVGTALFGAGTAQAKFSQAGVISPTVGFDPAAITEWRPEQFFVNQQIFVRTDPSLPGLSDFTLNVGCNCAINWFNHTTQVGGVAFPGPLNTGPIRTGSGDVSAWVEIPGGWTLLRGAGNWWVP
ncbi:MULTISPECIES: hypothetical protein [Rhodococcus]|uniref:Uncharacterized protein n=1 Tax=Rhodococcoides kyotonense TaxID=398843 RepID=A0A177YK80_9NOCA|nr:MULTISPECIES: hypothetical protein [Rhodococcus]NIL77499.1 hypothetical protein [Rhodococcus sp. B10]OAK55954.1 hypothetical protein A3K89_18775 [Rhodococcus kyotonensis]RRQ25931.1 hypothetical protein DK926_20380 [Rhodococcus sp. Eu-32]